MAPLVGLFHEIYGHGGQILYEFDRATPLSRVLAMNYCACKGSKYYYDGGVEGSPIYKAQPHEIAAQYAGIRAAYGYLEDVAGADFAEMAIREYQEYRRKTRSNLSGPSHGYDGHKGILLDLNLRFFETCDAHRSYDLPVRDPGKRRLAATDAVHVYGQRFPGSDLPGTVDRCGSGIRQDAMMCRAFQEVADGNRMFQRRAVFRGGWLTHDVAFGGVPSPMVPVPTRTEMDLGRLVADLDDVTANEQRWRESGLE